jgi:hypothetical protein
LRWNGLMYPRLRDTLKTESMQLEANLLSRFKKKKKSVAKFWLVTSKANTTRIEPSAIEGHVFVTHMEHQVYYKKLHKNFQSSCPWSKTTKDSWHLSCSKQIHTWKTLVQSLNYTMEIDYMFNMECPCGIAASNPPVYDGILLKWQPLRYALTDPCTNHIRSNKIKTMWSYNRSYADCSFLPEGFHGT